jgi:hypothetical protein
LLDFAFLKDLNAKLNELNTELQGENKITVKRTGTIDFFRGELKLQKTQLTKEVLTHFFCFQSRPDSTFCVLINYYRSLKEDLKTLYA